MSKADSPAPDAADKSIKNAIALVAVEPHLVDLSSPQALLLTRSFRQAGTSDLPKELNMPALVADARSSGAGHSTEVVSRLELPALTASELKEEAKQLERPDFVADWDTKHAALVSKAKHTDSKLQFFGDSITEFIGNGNMDAFDKNFAKYKPENFGIAGDTTVGLLKRVNDGELGGNPKAVVLLIGTNDVARGGNPDDIAQNIAKIVKSVRLHDPGAKVLVIGLLPRCAPDDPARSEILRKVAIVNSEVSQLDNGNTIRFVDIGSKFINANSQARVDLLPDYLHPNHAGYQVWSDAIKPVLDSMVK